MISVFWPARVGAIWRTSPRASSLDIEALEPALCANDPLLYSSDESFKHIQKDLTDFEKNPIM